MCGKLHPLVSVIIPTYNRKELLTECLTNLTKQTYKNFEVCLINDGGKSVNGVINQFETLEIHLFEFPSNKSQTRCRNKALNIANGEVIALCDDDDFFLPNHLDTLVNQLKNYDLVYSDVEILASDEQAGQSQNEESLLFSFDFDPDLLKKTNFIIPSSVIYKKALHKEIGIFDEAVGSYWDWDWFFRVSEVGHIKHIPKLTVTYNFDKGGRNLSSNPQLREKELEYFCKKHNLGKLPNTNFYLMAKLDLRKLGDFA